MPATVLMEVRAHLVWNWLSPSAVWIQGIKLIPLSPATAASLLKVLCCSKNAINGRLLFQTFVWWKDLLHTNADSLGLTESQSDNLSGFYHFLL